MLLNYWVLCTLTNIRIQIWLFLKHQKMENGYFWGKNGLWMKQICNKSDIFSTIWPYFLTLTIFKQQCNIIGNLKNPNCQKIDFWVNFSKLGGAEIPDRKKKLPWCPEWFKLWFKRKKRRKSLKNRRKSVQKLKNGHFWG